MAFELISEADYREIPHYKGLEVVHFGKYDWLVLKREKDHMLLLMKDVLEPGEQYHEESRAITWEKCTLRKWLNEDFYNTFTPEEQARILETHLENPDNEEYETKGGNDTDDKVFLLSLDEAEEYMTHDERNANCRCGCGRPAILRMVRRESFPAAASLLMVSLSTLSIGFVPL